MQNLRDKLLVNRLAAIPHSTYVMHGSKKRRRMLVPKKPAPTAINNKEFRRRGIYATSVIAIAVIYAVFNHDPIWKYGKAVKIRIRVPSDGFTLSSGYIHILRRESFTKNPFVSCSKLPTRALRVIKVSPSLLFHFQEKGHITFVEKF